MMMSRFSLFLPSPSVRHSCTFFPPPPFLLNPPFPLLPPPGCKVNVFFLLPSPVGKCGRESRTVSSRWGLSYCWTTLGNGCVEREFDWRQTIRLGPNKKFSTSNWDIRSMSLFLNYLSVLSIFIVACFLFRVRRPKCGVALRPPAPRPPPGDRPASQ